jgi:aryl-alcohol dehydrogenase-like predicted oxidoreductase
MARVALAWLLTRPVVSAPIVGATKPHHLTDAAAALELDLTEAELNELDEPYVERPRNWY